MQARNGLLVGFLTLGAALFIGCAPHGAGGAGASDDVGSLRLALQLSPGVSLDSASYAVTGPTPRTGTLDLRGSATLTATLGGLSAGPGYAISISAATGGLACAGAATFAVMPRVTTQVVVRVSCQQAPSTGSVHVTGVIQACPLVDELSATPAEAIVGAPLSLAASARDADGQPVTYLWSAPSGAFDSTSAAAPRFTCTAAGDVTITVTATDGDCSDALSTTVHCSPSPVLTVGATVETDPVPHAGDAADDPAIWINPADPASSAIIGTDKTAGGGLAVYDLAGHQLQFFAKGALNNVDLRDGFPLGGKTVSLVTAGNRTDDSIAIFTIDPATRQLSDVAARPITTLATYGSCMYHSPTTGKFYYFVDSKAGAIEQWELFDDGTGHVDATKVRDLHAVGTQPEACVVDDELGFFYIGEEDVGIWKYDAEPGADPADPLTNGVLVDGTGPGGHLVADVEGLAIAKTGPGTGYLIASNQGDGTYPIYRREGTNAYVKTFRVGAGACGVDQVSGSDGIDVTTAPLGAAFPHGVFVTQDDTNTPAGNQNFKLVPLQDILDGAGAAPGCGDGGSDAGAPSGDGPVSEGGMSGDGGAGFPAAFCAAFCGKCDACWHAGVGFDDGDCLYRLSKPSFSLDDCLAGCAAGATPGFPPANLAAGWEAMECAAWDDSM